MKHRGRTREAARQENRAGSRLGKIVSISEYKTSLETAMAGGFDDHKLYQ